MIQRLVDRIHREFSSIGRLLEISALDGNGDTFHVFRGDLGAVSTHTFAHILRDPGCFYFFTVSCMSDPDANGNQRVVRRELCWLTDPLPPTLQLAYGRALHVSWQPVRFCGVQTPPSLSSLRYAVEIAEGVDWREGTATRFMSDLTAVDYKEVFSGQNASDLLIDDLRPSRWYHLRLQVEYLGLRVQSESSAMHTIKAPPDAPSMPKISLMPVTSSFDLQSDVPVRVELLVSWSAANGNGCEVERYQVHLKRFDELGQLQTNDAEDPVITKRPPSSAGPAASSSAKHTQKNISKMFKLNREANQWIGSPGRCETQIRNSLQSRERSPSRTKAKVSRDKEREHEMERDSFFPSSSPSTYRQQSSKQNAWRIVYDNLHRSVKLASPLPTDAVWWLRVRAKNAQGWSDFSPVLVMSQKSHPSLFTATLRVPPPSSSSSAVGGADVSSSARPPLPGPFPDVSLSVSGPSVRAGDFEGKMSQDHVATTYSSLSEEPFETPSNYNNSMSYFNNNYAPLPQIQPQPESSSAMQENFHWNHPMSIAEKERPSSRSRMATDPIRNNVPNVSRLPSIQRK